MAAPLITTGSVIESWSLSQDASPDLHIEHLKSLPSGTTVTYQSPGSSQIVFAQLDGFFEELFHLTVAEKKGKRSSKKKLPLSLASNIKVAARQLEKTPIRRRRRPIAALGGLTSLIRGGGSSSLSIVPQLGCTLVSKRAKVATEIAGVDVSLVSDTELATGTLQDIVKLEILTDRKAFEPYTTKFISVDSKPNPQPNLTPIVVFDGCRGYLGRHSYWRDSTRIVVADRCESTFLDLTTIVNSELLYGKNRVDLELPRGIPAGVELTGFVQ